MFQRFKAALPTRTSMHTRRRAPITVAAIALLIPLAALASPVAIPNTFSDGASIEAEEFNENFDAIAAAVNDNDQRITDVEDAVSMDPTPAGAVVFFNLAACPTGWTEMTGMRGRMPLGLPNGGMLGATVGTDLEDQGTRSITETPSHVHTVNPPNTATTNEPAHFHAVDPPATNSGSDGGHTHTVNIGNGGAGNGHLQGVNSIGDPQIPDSSAPIVSAPDHNHLVNIAQFNSGVGGAHDHSVNIGQFNSGSAGAPSVDVTMPYMQLLACQKN
ncbi:MAG: hypothetical protein AAF721_30880 [Myxococcota bacterium]